MTEKKPRWANDPPPGFNPSGESIMVDSLDDLPPPPKIRAPDGTLYTKEEWDDLVNDVSDLDDDLPRIVPRNGRAPRAGSS